MLRYHASCTGKPWETFFYKIVMQSPWAPHEWWAPFHPRIKQGKLERLRLYALPKPRAKRGSGSGVVYNFLVGLQIFDPSPGATKAGPYRGGLCEFRHRVPGPVLRPVPNSFTWQGGQQTDPDKNPESPNLIRADAHSFRRCRCRFRNSNSSSP